MMVCKMNEVSLSVSSSPGSQATPCAQPFSAAELLRVWERGRRESPVEQGLLMLASACPGTPRESLAELSIGRRDACLLDLREKLFGPELSSLADCPGCGERLEMNFRVSDIRVTSEPESEPLSIKLSGYDLSFRLPNSLDLLALTARASVAEMRGKLFERCLLGVRRPGHARSASQPIPELPAKVIDLAIARMSEADMQADVRLNLTCPCCERRWKATFDIVSYLWSELQEQVTRLLREIHVIASAYGWREAEILALSPWRRQCYLEMLTG